MTEPYRWKLSPSKFEASKGCPCFTENQSWGKKYKDRGTDLHKLVEVEDAPLDGLEPNDCEAVLYCRNFMVELRELLGIRQGGGHRSPPRAAIRGASWTGSS